MHKFTLPLTENGNVIDREISEDHVSFRDVCQYLCGDNFYLCSEVYRGSVPWYLLIWGSNKTEQVLKKPTEVMERENTGVALCDLGILLEKLPKKYQKWEIRISQ